MNGTICALSTAPGAGAVALIRLSGPAAWEQVIKLSDRRGFAPQPRRAYLFNIYDGNSLLDKALVTFFKGPSSFTGEDTAEIACHGSPYVKGRLLEILVNNGVSPAKGGEFSMRAFLNGKMDLAQANALCDLIAADNSSAHRAAMYGMEGRLSDKFKEIKESVTELLAQAEVRIDDADNEMPPLDIPAASAALEKTKNIVAELAATFKTGKLVKDGIKVSIAGAPNAGKSSLLNALLGYDRAIVSEISGTTRDTVEDAFDYKGHKIILTDTAGIRTRVLDAAEKEGMARSLKSAENADIILFASDSAATPETEELYKKLKSQNKKIIPVETKSDLNKKIPFNLPERKIKTSCKTGQGIEELKEEIIKILDSVPAGKDGALITSALHYEALLKTGKDLEETIKTLQNNAGLEFTAEHLRRALLNLKEITGEVYADDILGIIFSKFCVGK